jgi:5-methylcytosine-specific restriction protein A
MDTVKSLVFRKITTTDFFNMYKPRGTEVRGGGQTYIDFPMSAISLTQWRTFLQGISFRNATNGPRWEVPIKSLGDPLNRVQDITIYQRRDATIAIGSQTLNRRNTNRVYAWDPDITNFPRPNDPTIHELIDDVCIYIAKLKNGEFWAGWFQSNMPENNWYINKKLNRMFVQSEGIINFNNDVSFDDEDNIWPFRISQKTMVPIPTAITASGANGDDEEIADRILWDEDEQLGTDSENRAVAEEIKRVRKRNAKAVKKLKALYRDRCQISGIDFTFKKRNSKYYSEAHHLIPLGRGGADSVHNIVILSPLIHRMLHHAKVENLDLPSIRDNSLTIKINGEDYTLHWHPDHAEIVRRANIVTD